MDRHGYVSMTLGAWLIATAFMWPHSSAQFANTWAAGASCLSIGAIAVSCPAARFGNLVLAVWLFLSAFFLPRATLWTTWNNAFVAIALFLSSLAPVENGGERSGRPPLTAAG
jgi:hypothetical protein